MWKHAFEASHPGNYLIVRSLSGWRLYCCSTISVIQRGPPDSPFAGGEYHGVLIFPAEYPFKPPGIKVCSS
jgi:ubiquitin-protein ligase